MRFAALRVVQESGPAHTELNKDVEWLDCREALRPAANPKRTAAQREREPIGGLSLH